VFAPGIGERRHSAAARSVQHDYDLGQLVLELVEILDDEPFRKR
jgi:hypothetical protein